MILAARLAILSLLVSGCTFTQCLEPEVRQQVVNALRWSAFWFGTPQGSAVSEKGVLFKSKGRTSALISPDGFWIMFVPSAVDVNRRILVRRSSGDLDREAMEYGRYLAGTSLPEETRERITAQCEFSLTDIPLIAPASQRVSRKNPEYIEAAETFIAEELSYAQCPCRYWLPYFDSSDPMGFALVEDRNKQLYFRGFYWDGSSKRFMAVPSPAEAPPYRPSDPLTQTLKRRILETPD